MKNMFEKLNAWEREHIPFLRRSKYYILLKIVILSPFILISLISNSFKYLNTLYTKFSIKTKNRPDIKLTNIVSGWVNLFIEDAVVEEIAMHRANICAKCPFAELSGGVYSVVIDNKTTHIQGMKCTKCGCPLSAKVRSRADKCPIGLW